MGMLCAVAGGVALNIEKKDFAASVKPGMSLNPGSQLLDLPLVVLGVLCLLICAFLCWLTVALWRGRKWSLWFMFLTHLPGALISGFSRDYVYSVVGLAVTIYTFLRISGNAGPKL